MKQIAFLGSGKIALEYSKVLKHLGYKVNYASCSSIKSKSWLKFKKANNEVKFLSNKDIIFNTKINYVFSLLPPLEQIKYLPKLFKSKQNIFIEKPFFNNSVKFKKILNMNQKNLNNKYISFNRRFYDVVNVLKARVKKRDVKLVRVNINENFTKKTLKKKINFKKFYPYYGSSSHIIDLLIYLFKKVKFIKNYNLNKSKDFPTQYAVLNCFKNTPIFLFIEKDAPLKNGIEIIFNDNSIWSLTPIEKLTVYKDYKISKSKGKNFNYLNYEQRKIMEKTEKSKFKPGFEKTVKFFLNSKKYNQNFLQYVSYLEIYEKIFN